MSVISAALPFSGGKDKSDLSLREKLALFGPSAIPLIIPYGSKGELVPGSPWNRYMKDWSRRTLKDTQSIDYQADLFNESAKKNIAIRQGGGLTDLCAWDFDTDDAQVITEFFEANPFAKEKGLFTVGNRGFTLWCKIKGPYPNRKTEMDIRGHKVEWRGNGYSVMHGLHPAGKMYQIFTVGESAWTL
jgi:hypothetical protein